MGLFQKIYLINISLQWLQMIKHKRERDQSWQGMMLFHNAEITKNDLLRPVNWGKSSFYLLWYWGRDNSDHTGPLYPILWSTAFSFLHIEHWSIVRPLVTTKPGWGLATSVVTSQGQKDTMGAWEKSGASQWYLISSKLPDCNIGLQLVTPSFGGETAANQ